MAPKPESSLAPYLFASVHQGPYLSILPLEGQFESDGVVYLVEGVSRDGRAVNGLPYLDLDLVEESWGSLENLLRKLRVKGVIRSTSEEVKERNVEKLVSAAAHMAGVPVFVIEDFPGNYWPQPGERLDGLFVEDDSVAALYESRGVDPQIVYPTGNPRYSELATLDKDALKSKTRMALGLGNERVVLWAGQPDGDNSYRALERILRNSGTQQAILLFRAHPRDGLYADGEYEQLLAETSWKVLDVSKYTDVIDLYCASDLVMTQFSSAGVEASYLGIPALFVLFSDLGKQWLRTYKGYDMLPWCQDGCAYLVENEEDVTPVLEKAIFDCTSRKRTSANFQRRFGVKNNSAQAIAQRVRAVAGA